VRQSANATSDDRNGRTLADLGAAAFILRW
jgi:hypothetical protein